MSDKKQIELTRQTFIAGVFKKAGEVVELPHLEANYLLNSGFAKEPEAEEPEAEEAEADEKPAKKAAAEKAK